MVTKIQLKAALEDVADKHGIAVTRAVLSEYARRPHPFFTGDHLRLRYVPESNYEALMANLQRELAVEP